MARSARLHVHVSSCSKHRARCVRLPHWQAMCARGLVETSPARGRGVVPSEVCRPSGQKRSGAGMALGGDRSSESSSRCLCSITRSSGLSRLAASARPALYQGPDGAPVHPVVRHGGRLHRPVLALEMVALGVLHHPGRCRSGEATDEEVSRSTDGLRDACVVRMSELHPACEVLTVDSDFLIYRRHGNRGINGTRPPSLA